MKVFELCLAICCITLSFSVSLSESDSHITTENSRKNLKSKRSSDEFTVEKENGTKKIESSKKKREVSEEESTCENTIQKEEVVIEELLKIIEEFKKYLNSKNVVKGRKMPSDSVTDGEDDKYNDGNVDDGLFFPEDTGKKVLKNFPQNEGMIEDVISVGRMTLVNKAPNNRFIEVQRHIQYLHLHTQRFPVMQKFYKFEHNTFQHIIGNPSRKGRPVEFPRYANNFPPINRGHEEVQFPNYQQPFIQRLRINVGNYPRLRQRNPSMKPFTPRQDRLKEYVTRR